MQNAPEIPRLLHEYLKQSVSGEHQLRMRLPDIEADRRHPPGQRQTVLAILGSGLMIVAGLLFAFRSGGPKVLLAYPLPPALLASAPLGLHGSPWPRK